VLNVDLLELSISSLKIGNLGLMLAHFIQQVLHTQFLLFVGVGQKQQLINVDLQLLVFAFQLRAKDIIFLLAVDVPTL